MPFFRTLYYLGNDMVHPADNARGIDHLPVAPRVPRDAQHSFATRPMLQQGLQWWWGSDRDVFCNKNHVAKGLLQQRPCCKVAFCNNVPVAKNCKKSCVAKGLAQHAHCWEIIWLQEEIRLLRNSSRSAGQRVAAPLLFCWLRGFRGLGFWKRCTPTWVIFQLSFNKPSKLLSHFGIFKFRSLGNLLLVLFS